MNYRPTVAYAGYFMYCSMCVAEYVVQLLNAVMEELMQPTPRTTGQALPPLCSRSSRPEKQVAIDNHTTRFQQRLWRGWSQESHVVAVFTLEFMQSRMHDDIGTLIAKMSRRRIPQHLRAIHRLRLKQSYLHNNAC